MFPANDFSIITSDINTANPEIKTSFDFDFFSKNFRVIDGNIKEINTIEAVKQWIRLFLMTDINKVPVYQNQKMGTSIKKIIGYKSINNGFVESELQREIEEGLLLNPAIDKITYFNMSKHNDTATITLNVMLKDGQIIEGLQTNV